VCNLEGLDIRLFYDVQHFIVKPPVEFSDHCLLSVFLEVYTQREVTQRLNSDFGQFQWDNSMSDNYHNNLLQQDSVNDILSEIYHLKVSVAYLYIKKWVDSHDSLKSCQDDF
jgi:hypothetical protein